MRHLIFILACTLMALVFAWAFDPLPSEIAIDWHDRMYLGIADGQLNYVELRGGPHHPPWSLLPVLPLGYLSKSAS